MQLSVFDTVECDDCYRKISTLDDYGFEDIHICGECWAKQRQEFVKKPCKLCKKLLGDEDVCWDEDGTNFAHTTCVDKLPEARKEEWSDEC